MDTGIRILAQALVAKFEEASRFVHHELVSGDPTIEGHAVMAMYPLRNGVINVPDPVRDRPHWEELAHYLKDKQNVSMAIVLRENRKFLLLVNAPIPFVQCLEDETVWMPQVVEAFQAVVDKSTKEMGDLFARMKA